MYQTASRVGPDTGRVSALAALKEGVASRADPQEAARSALAACLIVCVAQALYVLLDLPLFGQGIVVLLDGLHAALAAGLALWLWRRRSPRPIESDAAFLLIALMYLPIFWLSEFHGAALGLLREPLLGHKIVILGMALLAPSSLWLGAGLIAGFAVHGAVLLAALRAEGYRLVAVDAEPWVTILFGAVSIAYLVSRATRRAMMQRLAHMRAEALANQRLAQLFLDLRDRANTPLQTLELGTALLERRLPVERQVLAALRAAVARLREISSTLPTAGPPPDGFDVSGHARQSESTGAQRA